MQSSNRRLFALRLSSRRDDQEDHEEGGEKKVKDTSSLSSPNNNGGGGSPSLRSPFRTQKPFVLGPRSRHLFRGGEVLATSTSSSSHYLNTFHSSSFSSSDQEDSLLLLSSTTSTSSNNSNNSSSSHLQQLYLHRHHQQQHSNHHLYPNHHTDLQRTDSGNSSLSSPSASASGDSLSNGSGSFNSTSLDHNFSSAEEYASVSYIGLRSPIEEEEGTEVKDEERRRKRNEDDERLGPSFYVSVYVPETQREVTGIAVFEVFSPKIFYQFFIFQFEFSCHPRQTVWQLKEALIEQSQTSGGNNHHQVQQTLRENGLNHGLFCFPLGAFLDEQLRLCDYFSVDRQQQQQQLSSALSPTSTSTSPVVVRLEFLYKQRIKYGEVMSTLPICK